MDYIYLAIYALLILLAIIGLPVGLILYFVLRRRRYGVIQNADEVLRRKLLKDDIISQIFFLFALIFSTITLLEVNRSFHNLIPWYDIILLASLIGFVAAYFYKLPSMLVLCIAGAFLWWIPQVNVWAPSASFGAMPIFTSIFFASILIYLIGAFHNQPCRYKNFAGIYNALAIISITGLLFFMSTQTGIDVMSVTLKGSGTVLSIFASFLMTSSLILLLLVIFSFIIYLFIKKLVSLTELIIAIFLLILFTAITFLPQPELFVITSNYDRVLTTTGILWALFFNILIFAEASGLIIIGYYKKSRWLIDAGSIFLFFLIPIKYFSWFYSFLDKSIFFITIGLMLILIGWAMEKSRRYLLTSIRH